LRRRHDGAIPTGAVPKDLTGTYLRNGPNARFTPIGSYTYPLDGDGMIHAVSFAKGRAAYKNRYVRTPSMAAEELAGRALWGGLMTPIQPSAEQVGPELAARFKDLPDVSIVRHAGRLLALAESARPFLLSDNLDTVGPWYFGGKLPKGITAHPKVDPSTGELVVFRYDFEAPFLTWAVVDKDGVVTRAEQPVEIDAPYMIHDFAITARFIVLFICPARFDPSGGEMLRWEPERGTRIDDPSRWRICQTSPRRCCDSRSAYPSDCTGAGCLALANSVSLGLIGHSSVRYRTERATRIAYAEGLRGLVARAPATAPEPHDRQDHHRTSHRGRSR
jgi:carotenoid cleavage dioxygenase-like enzyme